MVEHTAKLGRIVLTHPLYGPDLASSDFPWPTQMEDGIHGQHFTNSDAVIAAMKHWFTSNVAEYIFFKQAWHAGSCPLLTKMLS